MTSPEHPACTIVTVVNGRIIRAPARFILPADLHAAWEWGDEDDEPDDEPDFSAPPDDHMEDTPAHHPCQPRANSMLGLPSPNGRRREADRQFRLRMTARRRMA